MQTEQIVRDSIRTHLEMMSKFMIEKNTHILINESNGKFLSHNKQETSSIKEAFDMSQKKAYSFAKETEYKYQPVSKYSMIDKELQRLYRSLNELSLNTEETL